MSDVKLHEYPRKYHIGFSLKKNLYLPVLERSNMSLAYKALLGTTNLLGYYSPEDTSARARRYSHIWMFSPQLNFLRLRMRLASWLERTFRFLEPREYLPVGECLSKVR